MDKCKMEKDQAATYKEATISTLKSLIQVIEEGVFYVVSLERKTVNSEIFFTENLDKSVPSGDIYLTLHIKKSKGIT